MSRIIVKNLPKKISEERLRSLFEALGQITDCSLKYTKDGVFRRFAFIGYRSEAEAASAVSHFDKTYIDTSRIQVEIAKDLGDASKPRAWSKYSQDSSAFKKNFGENRKDEVKHEKITQKNKTSKVDEVLGSLKEDDEFREFLAVHKSSSNKVLWSNDIAANAEQHKDLKTLKCKIKHDSETKRNTEALVKETICEEHEVKANKRTASCEAVSDYEYLKSKMTKSHLLSDDESDNSDTESHKLNISGEIDGSDNKLEKETASEQEECNFTYIVRMRGLPSNVKQSQITDFFNPIKIKSIKIPHTRKEKKSTRVASVTFYTETDMEQAMRRNKNFIGQKKVFLHKVKEKIKVASRNQPALWEIKKAEACEEADGIEESGRLFIRNLAYCCKEEDLEELFSKYGPLTELNLPLDNFTKKIKGFAFVTYMMPEHAVKAYTDLDGKVFQGRMLHILPAKLKKDSEIEITDSMSYKQKKELQRKKESSNSHNWNTLFLGANAVADVMADKYGTSKNQILSADSHQSLGVRLALGETQLVAETRDFLLEHGVALDAFSQPNAARSKTVILAKNLPASTKPEELQEIFSRFGTLGRVVLPPSGVTGIVEFAEPSEAKYAFNSLAYTKFKYVPLYLEWAPVGVFSSALQKTDNKDDHKDNMTSASKSDESKSEMNLAVDTENDNQELDNKQEPGSSIFVKNLNFDTTEEALMKHFQKCGKVLSVSIAKKKNMKEPGKLLSMGYGFVEFVKKESAEKALKRLQHSILDDHQLEIKVSKRAAITKQSNTTKRKQGAEKKQKSSKILVRNVPFEAKVEEIKELFGTFGELKFVRLPKKLTGSGSHRGFAFVDFVTKEDAKRAFNALCHSTHLYGRRLVLEWADTEDSIDQLRSKTADHFHEEPTKKRIKKTALMDELNAASKYDS